MYCEMPQLIYLIYPSPHIGTIFFFNLVVRTYNIYPLSKFQVYPTVLLTIVSITLHFQNLPCITETGFLVLIITYSVLV